MLSFRFNIRSKLIFSLSLLVLVIIFISTLFSYFRTSNAMQTEIQKYGIAVTKIFTKMATIHIFEMDYVTVLENALGLVKSSDIQSITIIDKNGKIWISTNNSEINPVPMTPFYEDIFRNKQLKYRKIRKDAEWILEFVNPITTLGIATHLVNVEVSLKSMEKQLAERTQSIFILSCVMTSMAVLLAIVLSKLLTDPIKALVNGTNEISQGNLDFRINVSSQDEIGELSQSFNRMAENLQVELSERKQAEQELKNHRDHLEELVKERTTELAEANVQLTLKIEERQLAIAALQESELKLSITLKSIGDAVIATGIERNVVLMNPVAEQLTGWTQKEAVGKDLIEVFNIVNEETGAEVENPVAKVLRRGVIVRLANQTILIAKDGARIPIDDSGAPITDGKGNIIGVVLIFRDVTEKRQAEKELRKHRNHLEEMVEARTKELKAAHDELIRKERLAALGQLTATVAHEIRNPLGTVKTSVFSIGDAIERHEMKRVDRALSLAARNIRRCDGIITELLDFTRQKELKKASMDVDVWLEGLLDEQELPEEIEYNPEMNCGILLSFDPEYLRRAVINVVTNAVQALAEEESPGNELKVETAVAGNRLEIRVIDTGSGIPDDIRETIFEPLFSTKSFGVGLGLTIVKDIMAEHGGGIEIESEPGKGTAVVLWLPIN